MTWSFLNRLYWTQSILSFVACLSSAPTSLVGNLSTILDVQRFALIYNERHVSYEGQFSVQQDSRTNRLAVALKTFLLLTLSGRTDKLKQLLVWCFAAHVCRLLADHTMDDN